MQFRITAFDNPRPTSAAFYGFYAEHDRRVTRSLSATKGAIAKLGKTDEPVMYPASEHTLVRLGEEGCDRTPVNMIARHNSLARSHACPVP